MFKIAILLSVLFTIVFKVNSLQCYTCYDCANLDLNDYLTTCESLVPSSSTTTPTTSTTSPTTSTTTTSTSTDSTSSSTTTSTDSTTVSTITPTSTTNTESITTSTTPTSTAISTTPTTTETLSVKKAGRADTSYVCFRGIVRENNTDIIVRGCAAGRTNETCETFGMISCAFCSTDKCNAAGSTQSSVAVLLLMLTYIFFLKN